MNLKNKVLANEQDLELHIKNLLYHYENCGSWTQKRLHRMIEEALIKYESMTNSREYERKYLQLKGGAE